MSDTTHWKYRNFGLFKSAPQDLFVRSQTKNTMGEWNRQIGGKENCTYFINGKKLSELQTTPFENETSFKNFLRETLYPTFKAEEQEQLIEMTMLAGYQSGLFHATNSAITQKSQGTNIVFPKTDTRIDMLVDERGLQVMETNLYKEWLDKSKNYQRHHCEDGKEYYAKTESTYLITPTTCELHDLIVDCPSRNLAPIFDERPTEDQRVRFPILRGLVAKIIDTIFRRPSIADEQKPDTEILHRTGPK